MDTIEPTTLNKNDVTIVPCYLATSNIPCSIHGINMGHKDHSKVVPELPEISPPITSDSTDQNDGLTSDNLDQLDTGSKKNTPKNDVAESFNSSLSVASYSLFLSTQRLPGTIFSHHAKFQRSQFIMFQKWLVKKVIPAIEDAAMKTPYNSFTITLDPEMDGNFVVEATHHYFGDSVTAVFYLIGNWITFSIKPNALQRKKIWDIIKEDDLAAKKRAGVPVYTSGWHVTITAKAIIVLALIFFLPQFFAYRIFF